MNEPISHGIHESDATTYLHSLRKSGGGVGNLQIVVIFYFQLNRVIKSHYAIAIHCPIFQIHLT